MCIRDRYSIYQKREQRIEQTPGPGDYEELKKEMKGVTIGEKLKERKPEDLPAPGQYTEKSYIVEGPQYSIYQKREHKIFVITRSRGLFDFMFSLLVN